MKVTTEPENIVNRRAMTASMELYLSGYRGKKVLYFPTPGNGGDSVIAVGVYQAFNRAGIDFEVINTSAALDGATLFLGGGGNLVPLYRELREYIEQYNILERVERLIVLPHSIRGNEDLLQKFDGKVTVFCREIDGYRHALKHCGTPHVYLEHDMAFHIDVEQFELDTRLYTDVSGLFAERLQTQGISLNEDSARHDWTFFRTDGEARDEPRCSSNNIDISKLFEFGTWPENAAKATWCMFEAVRRVEMVRTDRLHVAVSCALLNVPCQFYDNNYGKNSGIFEHSIQKFTKAVSMNR